MKSFLCPLHREFLCNHPPHLNRYISTALQASEDCLANDELEQAYIWSGRAIEAAQLAIDTERGWSIPTIMQFTACCIEFAKLSQLTNRHPQSVISACIVHLESVNKTYQLHKVIWVQDCLYALRLQLSTLSQETHDQSQNSHTKQEQQHVVMVH